MKILFFHVQTGSLGDTGLLTNYLCICFLDLGYGLKKDNV